MESCSEMAAAFEISVQIGDVRELPSFAFPSHRWLTGRQSRIVHHDHKEKRFLATGMPVGRTSHSEVVVESFSKACRNLRLKPDGVKDHP